MNCTCNAGHAEYCHLHPFDEFVCSISHRILPLFAVVYSLADRGNDGKTTSKSGLALNGNIILRKDENSKECRKLVVKFTAVPHPSVRLWDR